MIDTQVLLLNAAYAPIGIIPWKRAVILLYTPTKSGDTKAEVVSSYGDKFLRTARMKMNMPAIIRLREFTRPKKKVAVFKALKRKNIYDRDNGICQYCGLKLTYSASTMDHVHPKCKGGKDSWDNLVLSCLKCNNKKGNKTPEEVGMKLKRQPFAPKLFDSLDEAIIEKIKTIKTFDHESWADFLGVY